MTQENLHIKKFLADMTLDQKMKSVENDIRSNPEQFQFRWQLFLLLCLQGNWKRAIQQLQICAKIDESFSQQAQALRWLIKCEHLRENIFSQATHKPPFLGQEFDWMTQLFQALKLNLNNETEQADQSRAQALDLSPQCAGTINGEPFSWITDSDSRLGPVCEIYHSQNYWWLSFSQIKQINLYKPQETTNLIWVKGQFLLKDQTSFVAYIPVRYPLNNAKHNDHVLLSQYTYWEEEGETLVKAYGQKILSTDQKDFPLLECQKIIFD